MNNQRPPVLDPDLLSRLPRDPEKRIDAVVAHYRRERSPVQLFEALKMRTRLKLGLPMVPPPDEPSTFSGDEATKTIERGLEEGLLDACRQAGGMLIGDGKIGEGWMYLRPTGDIELVRRLIADVEITDENYDEMIHVLLHEGVDVQRGYDAVLKQQGTCNSITLFDQAISSRPKKDQQIAASCLLNHFYDELITLVRNDFRHRGPDHGVSADQIEKDAAELNLGELISRHTWILGTGGYHLDTTHLSATVRFAVILDDPGSIDRAIQLCQYGRRLPADFQYPGQEPFVNFYPAHLLFFGALLGRDVETAVQFFAEKARTVEIEASGTGAIETYIDLLDRVGRPGVALREAIELFPEDVPVQRVLPDMLAMARRAIQAGDKEIAAKLETFCFERGDLLAVAAITSDLTP